MKTKTTWIVGKTQTTTRDIKTTHGYRRVPVVVGLSFPTKKEAEEFRQWDGSEGLIVAPANAEYVAAEDYAMIGVAEWSLTQPRTDPSAAITALSSTDTPFSYENQNPR